MLTPVFDEGKSCWVKTVIELRDSSFSGHCVQVTELPFFATKVRLGRSGIEEIYPLGPLNEYER